jgi:hypothetical protein
MFSYIHCEKIVKDSFHQTKELLFFNFRTATIPPPNGRLGCPEFFQGLLAACSEGKYRGNPVRYSSQNTYPVSPCACWFSNA